MNNKVLWGVISAVVIFGFLTVVYLATSTPSTPQVFEETKVVKADDHTKWSPAKKHILTEYGDLQCPACQQFHQYIKGNIETDKTITDNITLVYRHFPLSMHKHAEEASYAAEAAGMQGKFFEMVDALFESQKDWENLGNTDEYFQGLAQELKLDMDKFNADKESSEAKEKVKNDQSSGNLSQVNSTPTFYLDGVKVDVVSLDAFKKLLQDTAKQNPQ